ncbi:MAG TPA: DUF2029 domain-containing protein [Chloroflexi bacterium]|nr:DUF2029 domain-containing protein [Chloroflexota bacterium]
MERRWARRGAWFVLALLLMLLLVWGNVRFARQHPGGNDFMVYWVAARAWLLEGRDPYSDAVALEAQRLAYGRPARGEEGQMRLVYPLYACGLVAPFALVDDYALARGVWNAVLEVLLVVMLGMALAVVRWKPPPWLLALLVVFTLTWYEAVRAVINGNAVVWVAAFLTGAAWAWRNKRETAAGVLLALATIKPQLALLPVAFAVFWGLSRRRWRLLGGLGGTLVVLMGLSMAWLPRWPLEELREVLRYPSYTPPNSLQAALRAWFPVAGRWLGAGVTAALSAVLAWAWWRSRHEAFPLLAYNLTLVASQWIGIATDPGNFLILFLPLVAWLALLFRKSRPRIRIAAVSLALGLVWGGLWWVFLATLTWQHGQPLQSLWMYLPLPAMLLAGLTWCATRGRDGDAWVRGGRML